ncbi:putative aromatic acid decarboxylase [Roseimaritima multifibrata]|uniref:Flavin prenyltransferase UbiX n=1 Tax=Roseimaritima multifibrata TaxID=1930274 RepID=A0A517MEV6_9BACT|nr:flavin prenyltransferase UbiX [Roseimaritima multifibrata]QDS93421.1 putative aromatic acid decarboxylase [Roseimaritima multifibrata]
MSSQDIVVAITGASGAIYAVRLLQILAKAGQTVHLTISPSGAAVIKQELDLSIDLSNFDPHPLLHCKAPWQQEKDGEESGDFPTDTIRYHHYQDYMTPIASGSFLTKGMVICPCSGSTLSAVARSAGSNLIQRAAEVHLKEQRKLVVVPRETPLSVFQLENMHRLASAGVVVLPAMPGWYHGVTCLEDLVDFVVSRIIDQLGIEHALIERWKNE